MLDKSALENKEKNADNTSCAESKDGRPLIGGYGGGYRYFKDENLIRDLLIKRHPENGPVTEANLDPERK